MCMQNLNPERKKEKGKNLNDPASTQKPINIGFALYHSSPMIDTPEAKGKNGRRNKGEKIETIQIQKSQVRASTNAAH